MGNHNIFRKASLTEYKLSRPKPVRQYADDMVLYLKRMRPDLTEAEISKFVQETTKASLNVPQLKVVTHPAPGEYKKELKTLLDVVQDLDDNIITPGGAVYCPPKKKVSLISKVIDDNIKERNVHKKRQLEAAVNGDAAQEQMSKLLQASVKIFNNSIPGVMGSKSSILSDLAGYNAITSVGRMCVKTGYAHTERLITGSLYIPDFDTLVKYVLNIIESPYYKSDQVREALDAFKLHQPSVQDLYDFLVSSLHYYTPVTDELSSKIMELLETLTMEERSYVFYFYSLFNLSKWNPDMFTQFITDLFEPVSISADSGLDPKDLFGIDDDLLNMALPVFFDIVDSNPKLHDVLVENPEKISHLLAQCISVESVIKKKYVKLFNAFFFGEPSFPRLWDHTDIVRKSVAVSDTDSVIFTSREILEFVTPKNMFGEFAQQTHFAVTYILSQSLEHKLGHMVTQLGVAPEARGRIKMKNEFYYPIFVRSALAKHYVGKIMIQEGKILPKPKLDLKGVSFRGSAIPKPAQDYFEKELIEWFYETMYRDGKFSAKELILKIAKYETTVFRSINSGEKTYLSLKSARVASDYARPEVTIYNQCEFWIDAFSETFGSLILPNKVWVVPLVDGKGFTKAEWRDTITSKKEKKVLEKIDAFFEVKGKSIMNRFAFPSDLKNIPHMIRPLIDYRRIVYENGSPMYLFASCLGGFFTDSKVLKTLATDMLTDEDCKLHDIDRIP